MHKQNKKDSFEQTKKGTLLTCLFIFCYLTLSQPSSNILRFMNDFYIYDQYISDIKEDLWRIYGKYENSPLSELPEDTSLKRAYKQWLLDGNSVGGGVGVIVFDGERIIN